MKEIFAIALGGGIGAVARHFLSYRVAQLLGFGFPFGTLAVNILGAFLMGILVILFAERYALSQEVRAFLTVGLLGGFTTFSAFTMETVLLMERHDYAHAFFYVAASVILALAALFAGMWAGRLI